MALQMLWFYRLNGFPERVQMPWVLVECWDRTLIMYAPKVFVWGLYLANWIKRGFIPVRFVVFILLFSIVGCGAENQKTEFMLGTVCRIHIWGGDKSDLDAAFDRIRNIESKMSRRLSGSEINRIGRGGAVQLSQDTCRVIKRALDFSHMSGGLFDISIAPVVELWGFGTEKTGIPSEENLRAALSLVDYRKIRVLDGCRVVTAPGQRIDLGGIAKGYASDEAAKLLQDAGVDRALLNLGGNVFALGSKEDGSPWKLGIQDPLQPQGGVLGTLEVSGGAVVTAGIYQRFVEQNGKKYHHILNPNTGYPAANNLAGVSISSPSGLDADALSTSLLLLGIDKGCKLLRSFPQSGAVFITKDRQITTCGTASSEFVLTSPDYQLIQRR
jgi:thiamine biosynthesis lipoprotein